MHCRHCHHHRDQGTERHAEHTCEFGLALPDGRELLGCPLEMLPSQHRVTQANQRTLLVLAQREGRLEELRQHYPHKPVQEYLRLLLLNTELAAVTVRGEGDARAIETGQDWAGRMGTWRGATERATVTVRYSQRLVSVAWEGMTLTSRLIEGEFPNYEKIIPEGQDKELEVGADALDDALARMLLLGGLDSNRVVFRLGDEVTVSAYNAGDTIEEVLGEARYSGEPLEIGVNGKFLREGLAAAGGETVRVQFGNALQPMLVASPAVPAWRYVVMPMQIIG